MNRIVQETKAITSVRLSRIKNMTEEQIVATLNIIESKKILANGLILESYEMLRSDLENELRCRGANELD